VRKKATLGGNQRSENSDVTANSLIESILLFAGYHVKYSKAWRAKQHAISLLWGDWKESYAFQGS
jgi:hypothetical protein